MDLVGSVCCRTGYAVQIDTSGQDLSVVVVRMVSTDLGTACGGKHAYILLPKRLSEFLENMLIALLILSGAGSVHLLKKSGRFLAL